MMQINEQQPVDQLVRTAAPATVADIPDIDRVLAELAEGIMAASPAGPRTAAVIELKRRRRQMILAPAAAITLLLSTAAGYALWHQTDSPDFAQALDRYANALPLPPGTDRAAYVASVAAQGTALAGSMSDAGVESMASYYGFCAWATAWERRDAAGDHAGAASAASSLRALHLTGLVLVRASPRAVSAGTVDAGRVPGGAGRPWRDRAWPGALDELAVADRVVADRELQDAKEHQAAAAGGATVEPEAELIDSFELVGECAGQVRCPVWRT